MTFTSTIDKQTFFGDMRIVIGHWSNSGASTGGDVETGLQTVYYFGLTPLSTAVTANAPVANETFPLGGKTPVTVITDAECDGVWFAIGK